MQLADQKCQRFAEEAIERKRREEEKEDQVWNTKLEDEKEAEEEVQASGSGDGVAVGGVGKRNIVYARGDDLMPMEAEEISEVEVSDERDVG